MGDDESRREDARIGESGAVAYLIVFQLAAILTFLAWPWKPLKIIGLSVLAVLGG